MTNAQRLSALQDDELDSASTSRLLDALAQEPPLRATWERYHLIGQVIRGEQIDLTHCGIAERVRAALDDEPLPFVSRRRLRLPMRRRHAMSMALAATVAFVALFTAPLLFQDVPRQLAHTPPAPTTTVAVIAADAPRSDQRWNLDRPDLASKLDLFLVTHQATASTTSANSMLPYATLVGYPAPR